MKLSKSKKSSGVCAYSADFVCIWEEKEMQQEYKVCLDGQFYFAEIISCLS